MQRVTNTAHAALRAPGDGASSLVTDLDNEGKGREGEWEDGFCGCFC